MIDQVVMRVPPRARSMTLGAAELRPSMPSARFHGEVRSVAEAKWCVARFSAAGRRRSRGMARRGRS
jgi:hypothetical protein